MDYGNLKGSIRNHLNNAAEDFFMVGYCLRQISEHALFTEDGYKSIWDFAKGEYGLSASSASRFMAINARFSVDDGEHMAEKYIGMGVSKLQEMLGLPDEELDKVTQETTVREIRAMKKNQEEQKSFFGLPKTVYPEDSSLTTPGCGDGKYACFSCARPCDIRQEERYCRTATMGNPFPCTQMDEEKRLDMEAGIYSEECQHLHPEFAPVREGDKEPAPCCLTCEHKACFSRCDVAKERDEDERKKEQKEKMEQLEELQEETEDDKPDMTKKEMKNLYLELDIKPEDRITASWLRKKYGMSRHGGCNPEFSFSCTPRGARAGESREMTWGEVAKAFVEIQVEEKEVRDAASQDFPRETERQTAAEPDEAPNITDADFQAVENGPKEIPEKEESGSDAAVLQERERRLKYSRFDVESILKKETGYLDERYEAGSPEIFVRKHKILVDALTLLAKCMGGNGGRKRTNADRIRSMTNEELADFFCKVKADYQWSEQEFPSEDAGGDWEEWLESECDMG